MRLLNVALGTSPQPGALPLRFAAMGATLLFAVHPLRVEAVAWATARGYLVGGFFFLLTLLMYLRAVDSSALSGRGKLYLWLSMAAFAACLLSVPAGVTLPLVLVVLDVYPLKRLPAAGRWFRGPAARIWLEKSGFFLMAFALAAVTPLAKRLEGSLTPIPLLHGLALSAYGIASGFLKTLLPVGLSPMYPTPKGLQVTEPVYVFSAVLIAGMTIGLVLLRRRFPAGLAVWVCYLVLMVPVSRIVHYGLLVTADRYTYLSALGFPLLAAGIALRLWQQRSRRGILFLVPAVAIITALAVSTRVHVGFWKDSESLFRRALQVDPHCSQAMSNLGNIYVDQAQFERAVPLFLKALSIDPEDRYAHLNLARILTFQGRPEQALKHLHIALAQSPSNPAINYHLAVALACTGQASAAVDRYRVCFDGRIEPLNACTELAKSLKAEGFHAAAANVYRFGLDSFPDNVLLLNSLAWLQATSPDAQVRNGQEAVAHAQQAVELGPIEHQAFLLDSLAVAWAQAGEFEKAINLAEQAREAALERGYAEAAEQISRHLELFRSGQPVRD